MFKRNKKAFTIVELVIVIAVIAILMGIMFIGGTAINNNAKKSALGSDLRNYEIALKSFVNDKDNDKIVKGLNPGTAGTEDVYKMLANYLEDDMAPKLGKFNEKLAADKESQVSFCATADSKASYSAELKMLDPYGVPYRMTVLNNSTKLHTDIAYCVISYGQNKQTFSSAAANQNDGQGSMLDKDDVMLVVRVVDSVIYTGTYECDGTDDVPYWVAVSNAAKTGITTQDVLTVAP